MRRRVSDKRAAQKTQRSDLAAVAKAFTGFRPASEVLTRVRAVPTIFPQFDHGTKVGGLPTERIALLHGPSGEGKTYFTLGLVRSFVALGNPTYFVDAERTTPENFVRLALGDLASSPLFLADRPSTYEAVVQDVRKFCNRVKELRAAGKLSADACGLIIVDSIRKLVPAEQWKKILELSKEKDDGKVRNRGAQIKAMMNAAWCDELIPLLEQTGCTMVVIARESDDPNADARAKMYGGGYITGGGKALYYDASLDIRVERAKYVTKDMGEGARPLVYGERHRITIKKSKVAGKEDKTTVCYFHTSNGKLVPEGFDRARDVLELARRFEIVKAPGARGKKKSAKAAGGGWMMWGGHRWQGEHAAVKRLTEQPDVLAKLEAEVRERFTTDRPTEIDDATGEVLE